MDLLKLVKQRCTTRGFTDKKIEKEDYRNLPQKTKREKHYYQQAKRREQRKSARRVMNIFEQLERKEDIKQYSFW